MNSRVKNVKHYLIYLYQNQYKFQEKKRRSLYTCNFSRLFSSETDLYFVIQMRNKIWFILNDYDEKKAVEKVYRNSHERSSAFLLHDFRANRFNFSSTVAFAPQFHGTNRGLATMVHARFLRSSDHFPSPIYINTDRANCNTSLRMRVRPCPTVSEM